jgi:Tubulin like
MRSNVVFRPTVVIGLGGTGHGAILKLKRRFIDAYGSVPPIISFISIDTTENVEHSEKSREGLPVSLEPNSERYVLSVANPGALVNGTNEHIDEWWPRNVPIAAINAGAGQVRARGRLALFAKSRNIFAAVRKAIDDVKHIKNTKQMYKESFQVSDRGGVEVYIVSSLAGGTGSGTFLDIAFIARSFLDALSNVTGVLVLPRVFSSLAGVALVKPNAYGALKEIERFSRMNLGDQFTINYGTDEVQVTRPPFDLLYLIDSINETGNVVSETRDLLTLVADGLYIQIGSQIGTDADNTVDNIKTQLAVAGQVRGRSASYCSFGVASLALPLQQYEMMKINDARKLLSDGLLNGVFLEGALEAEVVRFLGDHKLREDEVDDVIDVLAEREGGGRMRFPMPLGQMKNDKTAAATIKQLHATHRSRMERGVAQGLEVNHKRLHEAAKRAIDDWWQEAINRPNGLTYAQRFAEKLLAKLEWYQRMMESESKEEQERLKALNFTPLEEQVREAGTAFVRRESRVRTACENYKGLVERECELYLQAARRDKAAELYGELRSHVEDILRRCGLMRLNLEASLKKFEQDYLDATNSRSGESPFEHTVRFNAEANKPEITPEDFVRWYREEHGTLSAWSGMRTDDVAREIMDFIKQKYLPLTDLSIDDVLQRSDAGHLSQDLKQLSSLAVPLWRYDEGKIPVVNRGIIDELFHYGVADADSTLLKDPKVYGKVPQGTNAPSFISTLNPHRITLFKVKVGVPLFALQGIDEMERAYKDPDKTVSNHLHREWESFPNLIPRAGDGAALRWFAIAQAPAPFEIIKREGQWYYIRSQKAKKVEGGQIRLGQGRINAYTFFEKNQELVKEVEEKIDSITRTEGEMKINAVLREYVDQLAKQVSGREVDASIKEQVEGEIQAIEGHLQEMTKLR